MQCSDIKSEVAYKVGKRDPLERKDIPATAVKMYIDVAEIMKQNDRYDTEQEQQETPEQTALPGITEEPETGDLQEKDEAKEEDEEENALSRALDFMSILLNPGTRILYIKTSPQIHIYMYLLKIHIDILSKKGYY